MNRALLLVAAWVGQAVALWLSTSRRPLVAEILALRERLEKLRAQNDLLRARLERIEPHRRPRYLPWERLGILLHRARYGLSLEATAKAFLVTHQTVINWLKELESGMARLVQARKPINALPDLVRELTWFLKRQWPRWGTRRVAGILGRLGLQASRSSVQRLLRRPPPPPAAAGRPGRARPIRARRPDHVWIVDLTQVRQFFRRLVVGCVLDAFSRKVLALRAWATEPDSSGVCLLLRDAVRAGHRATWIVSDRGTQFTARRFKAFLARNRIRRRYAAVGDANLARIDRFWRTLKEEYARGLLLFRPLRAIERQLAAYASWYNAERPNAGLGLAVPADVHARIARRRVGRVHHAALEVRFVGGDPNLPLFRLRKAA